MITTKKRVEKERNKVGLTRTAPVANGQDGSWKQDTV